MMIPRILSALAPLIVVLIAFSLVLGGPAGPGILFRSVCRLFALILRRTVMAGVFILITVVDAALTVVRAVYHLLVPLQAWRVADDWIEFLFRLNDRFFKLALA